MRNELLPGTVPGTLHVRALLLLPGTCSISVLYVASILYD